MYKRQTSICIQDTTDLFINTTYNYFGSLESYQIHLDCMEFVTAGAYNSTDNTTTVSWPNRVASIFNNTPSVVDASTGEVFMHKSNSGDNFVFHGNFAGRSVIIGYRFMCILALPTFYVQQKSGNKSTTDVTASLIIQRIHYHFGQLSNVELFNTSGGTINSTGSVPGNSANYQNIYPIISNRYKSDKLIGDSDITITDPIYQRNTNVEHHLFTDHPGPCTLHSLTWEGDYTPKFHKRV